LVGRCLAGRLLSARGRHPCGRKCRPHDSMESIRSAFCKPTSWEARLLLRYLSLGSGGFLVFAGAWGGLSTPMLGGGLVYFIGAMYAVLFGLTVLTVELKDKYKYISAYYVWLDTYLKFLMLQRGKGAFYLGVGVLVMFMSPNTSFFGINNVAAIVLAIVGFLHAFRVIKESSSLLPGSLEPVPAADGLDFSQPINAQARNT